MIQNSLFRVCFQPTTMLHCCTTCISWEIGSYNTQQSHHNEHTPCCRNFVVKSVIWFFRKCGGDQRPFSKIQPFWKGHFPLAPNIMGPWMGPISLHRIPSYLSPGHAVTPISPGKHIHTFTQNWHSTCSRYSRSPHWAQRTVFDDSMLIINGIPENCRDRRAQDIMYITHSSQNQKSNFLGNNCDLMYV